MEPLVLCLWIFGGVSAGTWLLSLLTREYSWTDRVWSIAPIAYVAVFAVADPGNARLVVMLVLVSLWGVRLTYNFARKGGYGRGGEDYRWKVLRERLRPGAVKGWQTTDGAYRGCLTPACGRVLKLEVVRTVDLI